MNGKQKYIPLVLHHIDEDYDEIFRKLWSISNSSKVNEV
jgi:hypothetical protein